MELTIDKSTHIGLGYANHADAFQCGREAAQMAKSQLPNQENDLILVFCPNGVHFKDFIEGVRLVLGENKLVGLPVDWALSNDLPSIGSCIVLIAQFASIFTSMTSAPENLSDEAALSSLITQFRQYRGSAKDVFPHRGLFLLENKGVDSLEALSKKLACDVNMDTWLAGLSASGKDTNPIVCRNQLIRKGFAAMEFFSSNPIGIGQMTLNSFNSTMEIYREAARSVIRDAAGQMDHKNLAFGLLLFTPSTPNMSSDEIGSIFRSGATSLPQVPLVMIPTRHHFSRQTRRSISVQQGAITAILFPK